MLSDSPGSSRYPVAPCKSSSKLPPTAVPRRLDLRRTYGYERIEDNKRTTAMIRYIPYGYTPTELLDEIHSCLGFQDTYDFFYLPANSKMSCNVGYGFINFRDPATCSAFIQAFVEHTFCRTMNGRKARGQASYAHVQGLDANLKYLRRTRVGSINTQAKGKTSLYTPLVFLEGSQTPASVNRAARMRASTAGSVASPVLSNEQVSSSSQSLDGCSNVEAIVDLLEQLISTTEICRTPLHLMDEIRTLEETTSPSSSSGNPFDF